VLGNPPFVGKQFATAEQKADMERVCGHVKGGGVLDYACAWYFRAADYIQGTDIVVGFVSTNSISQGEQVGILWSALFGQYHVKIHFAHRTFAWQSEARGKAHVHVVIIGFGARNAVGKRIYDYNSKGETVTAAAASNISPYLVEGGDIVVLPRSQPINGAPAIVFGNMPNDGGHLVLTEEERAELIAKEPQAAKFIRPFLGSQEFIHGQRRWCLWLVGILPAKLRAMPETMARVDRVRRHRRASPRPTTRELANTPTLFGEIRQPDSDYLLIPSVSSEDRRYIPIGFMPKTTIGSNLVLFVPRATLYQFGILSSAMHLAWVRQVCGRLKSDLRYSNRLVYNNYPWPDGPNDEQRAAVESASQRVLDARKKYTANGATLADLYDALAMPPQFAQAHAALDRAVDRCYRSRPFTTERQRVEFLFEMYSNITAPLLPARRKRRSQARIERAPRAALNGNSATDARD
jgi:hypothetical protein